MAATYLIASLMGAWAGMYALSRLTLWLFRPIPSQHRRIFTAHLVAICIADLAGGFSFYADSGAGGAIKALVFYTTSGIFWLLTDLGRAAKRADTPDGQTA